MKLEEHFVVIVPPVHNKGSLAKENFPLSIAEKVILLTDVKAFSLEECIFEKILTGWLFLERTQASVT